MTDADHAPTPGSDERPSRTPERKKLNVSKRTLIISSGVIILVLGVIVIYQALEGPKERAGAANVVTVPELGGQIAKGLEPLFEKITTALDSTNAQVKDLKGDTADIKKKLDDQQKQIDELKDRPVELDTTNLPESLKKSLEHFKPKARYSTAPVPPAKPRLIEASAPASKLSPRALVPPPSKPEVRHAAALSCKKGADVHYSRDTFHIDVLAVEDGSGVVNVIGGRNYAAWGRPLLEAVKKRTVQRFPGDGTVTFHLLHVDSAQLPDRVPYLEGNGVCAGDAAVVDRGIGFADVEVPIGGKRAGQVSLVLPIGVVAPKTASACIETDFPLAYAPRLTAGSYKGAKNVLCGSPFGPQVAAGERWGMFVLIHGQEHGA